MNREMLYAYLDGELSPEEAARLEAALAEDRALRLDLEQLRRVENALETLPGRDAAEGFTERVVAAARRKRPGGLLVRLAVPLAAAAALVLAVFVPRGETGPSPGDPFTNDEHLDYVWESDAETFGSLSLDELEGQILEELDSA